MPVRNEPVSIRLMADLSGSTTSTVETPPPGDLIRPEDSASRDEFAVPESVDRRCELLLPTKRSTVDSELTGSPKLSRAHTRPARRL